MDYYESLKYMNNNNITYDICLRNVKYDSRELEYVPNEYMTIEKDGCAIQYVPNKYITLELYKLGIKGGRKDSD